MFSILRDDEAIIEADTLSEALSQLGDLDDLINYVEDPAFFHSGYAHTLIDDIAQALDEGEEAGDTREYVLNTYRLDEAGYRDLQDRVAHPPAIALCDAQRFVCHAYGLEHFRIKVIGRDT